MKRLFVFLLAGLVSCAQQEEPTPTDPLQRLMEMPGHFPPAPAVPYNPLTADGVRLGRQLFFDPALSSNGKVSCAGCHFQEKAFTDGEALAAHGVSGNRLLRNSPTLANLAWATNGLFWDGGATNLESQIIGPITHPDEMGLNILALTDHLSTNPAYPGLFRKAFPDDGMTSATVLKAIAQYIRTLVSAGAPYDVYAKGKSTLTTRQLQGMALFDRHCSGCHIRQTNLFTDHLFHNNGLDSAFSDAHEREAEGRYRVTNKPEDLGKFKTPTLRNIALTAPYMHDGRLATLSDVLRHYASGIVKSTTLDSRLPVPGLALSNEDQEAIIAFLETLTDTGFLTNADFKP